MVNISLQQELPAIFQLVQQGNAEEAMRRVKPLLRKHGQNADVTHIAALVYKARGEHEEAIRFFLRSLALNGKQPQVLNNLANVYKAEERYAEAEEHYQQAISLHPEYLEAKRNLGLNYLSQENYQAAAEAFKLALAQQGNDVSSLTGLADCFRERGDFSTAEQLYRQALEISPQNLFAWYKLGQNYHLDGQIEQARDCYQRAYQIDPQQVAVVQSLGSLIHEEGSTDSAINLFVSTLNQHPDAVSLHERLNEILFESKYAAQFGNSYRQAISQLPDHLDLHLSYIAQLFRAGQIEAVNAELESALGRFNNSHQLLSLQGQMLADQFNYDEAAETLTQSLRLQFSKDAAQNLVKVFIIQNRYAESQELLNRLFDWEPDCQLNWALQSLVWRLVDDPRYAWLNDYDRLVRAYQLEVPVGFDSLEDFLRSLRDLLLSLHQTENAPLQQTLRQGTQTSARLLHRHDPELRALKKSLAKVVEMYIDEMPDDVEHPLLRRKTDNFEFSGSWSVKLRPNGFHVNHVHPAGWISSSCYISIPDTMQQQTDSVEGHIKFGESPLSLGDREVVEKVVKPEPGMVVLFPSYMWHGTYPFSGTEDEVRITSPFDVIPA
ncbi:MAG: tetratricopeptide repeat protein [Pseudomonadota bacterium]